MNNVALYTAVAAALVAAAVASNAAHAAAQSTAFTYQGQLNANGALADGTYQFTFRLYDAASNGNAIGTPIAQAIAVTNGLFTTQLDFGAVFVGQQTWLDIQVGTSVGNEQSLSARQPVDAAPVAQYALHSGDRALSLHYTATAANQSSSNSIPLGTLNGVSYSLQCWFSPVTNKLTEELDAVSPIAFDVHEEPFVQTDSAAIGAPQFLNATNFTGAQLWSNLVASGGHQEQLHMPLTIDLHSTPEQVQQGHVYLRATTIGFGSATANTCDIEGELVPAS